MTGNSTTAANVYDTGKLKTATQYNSREKLKMKINVQEDREIPLEDVIRMTKLGK